MPSLFHPKALPADILHKSPEVLAWLEQVHLQDQAIMAGMLLSLRFVSHDDYAGWLRSEIDKFNNLGPIALYSVGKLKKGKSYWNAQNLPEPRPACSQGSEDFVYSIISTIVKENRIDRYDHPSIVELKTKKIKKIVLIDDSVGSGDRISSFICAMMESKSFRSWWSYGKLHIHILTYGRNRSAESNIINSVFGSDHYTRKFPKSKKIFFASTFVFDEHYKASRWGLNFQQAEQFCLNLSNVPITSRLGYGEVMSNLVFFHSVPNNIPGFFWRKTKSWTPLFPGRTLPTWVMQAFSPGAGQTQPNRADYNLDPSGNLFQVINLIKSGVRSFTGISLRLNWNVEYAKALVQRGIELGLISPTRRVTPPGQNALRSAKQPKQIDTYDRSMYIPTEWCTDLDPFSR
jgi:hypothetical protein